MIAVTQIERNGFRLTPDEHTAVLRECRRALSDAFLDEYGDLEPANRHAWGWRYSWRPVKRDKDGSLCLVIRVYDARHVQARMQRIRLVRRQPLTRE